MPIFLYLASALKDFSTSSIALPLSKLKNQSLAIIDSLSFHLLSVKFLSLDILRTMSIEGSASITDLVSCLWNCASPQAAYICRFEENRDDLRNALNELKGLKDDTMRKVENEERRGKKRLAHVQWWFSRVDDVLKEDEVEQLLKDASQEIEKKCLGGCCPKNCKRSYKLGKRVAKKLKEVNDLKSKSNFEAVADEQHLPLVDKRPTEPTVGLKSTFDEVWSYIEDEQTGIIGIYGVGGVGKSTLLVEINNKFVDTTHGFDVVIWTVVSRNPSSIKVQEDIGKKIGFVEEAWKNKSQDEKTLDILRVLGEKKFVLLLDDIWEWFDLLKVGVPLPDQQINKSKVVFTTRSKEVCGSMGAQKIEVRSLEWEEAWDLFQKKVGKETINSQSEIPELAEIVARECDGLPLALITIGRAMACKMTPQDWRHAITMLKKSAAEFAGMEDNVYHRLKFSYDNLQNNIIKSCFLYCSLFSEDYLISKNGLINYWISEGFLDEFDDFNEAQNSGHYIISTLTNACLLEEDSSGSVKMHDVIRDMALWIACECGKAKNKVFVQARAGLTKAPVVEKWKEVERMSLMENKIEELSGTPSCPNLLTLFLNRNKLQMITHGFFQNMPNLRVLDLSCNQIEELTGTPSCPNLLTLLLDGNHLQMITHGFFQNMPHLRVLDLSDNFRLGELPMEISELVSLRYLGLSRTNIRELPIEFKKLVELKYLGLCGTTELDIIPAGVLSSFKKLLVLNMWSCGLSVEVDSGVEEALVKEMEWLKELNDLSILIRTSSAFSRILSSPKLRSCTTSLRLHAFRGSEYLDMSFLQSMTSLKDIWISNWADLEELGVERVREGLRNSEITSQLSFLSLKDVSVTGCPMLKRELTWLIFAPNLDSLWIYSCDKIEEVICGGGGKWSEAAEEGGYPSLFEKLEKLSLSDLPQLKSICPNALPFPCLDRIEVSRCPNLKKLPLNSDSAKGRKLVIKGSQDWWNGLEWEDEAARNAILPSFQSF